MNSTDVRIATIIEDMNDARLMDVHFILSYSGRLWKYNPISRTYLLVEDAPLLSSAAGLNNEYGITIDSNIYLAHLNQVIDIGHKIVSIGQDYDDNGCVNIITDDGQWVSVHEATRRCTVVENEVKQILSCYYLSITILYNDGRVRNISKRELPPKVIEYRIDENGEIIDLKNDIMITSTGVYRHNLDKIVKISDDTNFAKIMYYGRGHPPMSSTTKTIGLKDGDLYELSLKGSIKIYTKNKKWIDLISVIDKSLVIDSSGNAYIIKPNLRNHLSPILQLSELPWRQINSDYYSINTKSARTKLN